MNDAPETDTMSDLQLVIAETEARVSAAGSSVPDLCRRAEIHVTTWGRWKAEKVGPTMRKWARVSRALADIEAEARGTV